MKYWRGYLVAAIIAVLSWALMQFAQAHVELMDMVYPYMSRVMLTSLAAWSGSLEFCLWQVLVLVFVLAILVVVVLMVLLRWNPIQVFGWILVPISLYSFLNTAVYGLNVHTGSIAQDVRMETADYSPAALEEAASYYLGKANALSAKVSRDSGNNLDFGDFADLAADGGEGFEKLTYEQHFAVFAGSLDPVKELDWADRYTKKGITGVTVALTGEAAVNPQTPDLALPFAICKEMAHRMAIVRDGDGEFAAILACIENSSLEYQYSGYLLAFRYCYNQLKEMDSSAAHAALLRVEKSLTPLLERDMKDYNKFLGDSAQAGDEEAAYLLVNWHIQTVVLPRQASEEDTEELFDPMDETNENLLDVIQPTAEPVPPTTAPAQ